MNKSIIIIFCTKKGCVFLHQKFLRRGSDSKTKTKHNAFSEIMKDIRKLLKLKFDSSYDSVREVTFCEHVTENPCPQKPMKRTLFLTNVPPWANEQGLRRIFEANGKVQNVFLSRKASSNLTEEESRDYVGIERFLWPPKDTSGFKVAYIVFEKASGVKKSLQSMDLSQAYIISDEENLVSMGKLFHVNSYQSTLKCIF